MFDFLLEGSTIVEKVIGENISVEAVKKILKIAKTARKKLQRVNVTVSLKGIEVSDTQGNELFKISIYRISNCSTDASHRQVNNLLPPPPIKSINHPSSFLGIFLHLHWWTRDDGMPRFPLSKA